MKTIIEKLKKIIVSLEESHGPILIFALFLREDPLDKWDIVTSASWLDASNMNSYNLVSSKIQESLSSTELTKLARVVILDKDDLVVNYLQDNFSITNGNYEDIPAHELTSRFGFTITQAFLLRCRRS